MLEQALIAIGSFLVALVMTPIIRQVAIRLDIVDHPDQHRKLHGRLVARAGGTAVLISVIAICSIGLLSFDLGRLDWSKYQPFIALLAAMIATWLLGLADDVWTLRGRQKLFGQIVIAGGLVWAGFEIDTVGFFGYSVDLGLAAAPVSIMWLLLTTNALNLIDGADGLCSTLGAIICGALGVLASVNGHFAEAAIAFAMSGALLGFLVYNFPPATIFLGDSGSLLIGMVTGALAIRCALKGPTTVAFLAPLAIMAIPLLDSTMAIIRRKLTGRSIYTVDRAHLHHTLRGRGLGDRGLLLVVAVMALVTAGGALASQALGREWLAPVSVAAVFGLLVATKAFGYAEVVLIGRRASHFALSMLEPARKADESTRVRAVRLQGTRQWEKIWEVLIDFAEREGLCRLHMDLHVPWLEEGFHGSWQRSRMPDRLERWSTCLPIYASGRIAGRLDIVGPALEGTALDSIAKLVELLEELTPRVEDLLAPEPVVEETAEVEAVSETANAVAS